MLRCLKSGKAGSVGIQVPSKGDAMAVSADLGSILDKQYEEKDLKEILAAQALAVLGESSGR